MNKSFAFALLLFMPFSASIGEDAKSDFREWTDSSGEHKVRARFVELNGVRASFERENGEKFEVPLADLSAADVAHISGGVVVDSLEGVWGGKWDDEWPVFIVVEKQPDGSYDVGYNWYENLSRPMQSRTQAGEMKGDYMKSGALLFRRDNNQVLLYGSFRRPRAARLVKLNVSKDSLADVDLDEQGWKSGTLPAGEAKKKITGE